MEDKTFDLLTKMYNEFSGRFDRLENDVGTLKTDMSGLKVDVDSLTTRVIKLEKVVTRIEHAQYDKFGALFDGYKQMNDKLDRIEIEVSKHEEVILKRVR